MSREEKYPWFFKNSWENVEDFIDTQRQTTTEMRIALHRLHQKQGSYSVAARKSKITKQRISQWLKAKGNLIDMGKLKIEIHREDIQTD